MSFIMFFKHIEKSVNKRRNTLFFRLQTSMIDFFSKLVIKIRKRYLKTSFSQLDFTQVQPTFYAKDL